MAHVNFTDEIVKEYLLFRGFSTTLKSFDNDLKVDKDKGFRVDKVVDNLLQCVYNYDLGGLREAWTHLSNRLFTKLDHNFSAAIRKLETAILKFYLINAVENNKIDKVNEFFSKMAQELSMQAEWKEWFILPFIKNPEENPTFALFFTRLWQESLFVSLYNFLAAVYQNLPQPTLASFEESATKIAALQKENEMLRKGLANLLSNSETEKTNVPDDLSDIMDDFYNISEEVKVAETQAKTLKLFMKIGSGSSVSPKSAVQHPSSATAKKTGIKKFPTSKRSSSIDARSSGSRSRDRDSSLDINTSRHRVESTNAARGVTYSEGSFLFLSQDEYNEHKCEIAVLELNGRGNMVASLDKNGFLRVWSTPPSCRTVAVFPPWPSAEFVKWVLHHERYLICADRAGAVRLLDVKVKVQQLWEISLQLEPGSRLENITSNPVESSALLLVAGKLLYLDLKSKRVEKTINVSGHVTCCAFTQNGLQLVVGCEDGNVVLLDVRKNEIIDTLPALSSGARHIHLTVDNCYYFSVDRQFRWLTLQAKDNIRSAMFPTEAQLPHDPIRPFCLDSSGTFLLTLGNTSGIIYKVTDNSITKCLELGGHNAKLVCVDWCFANQCATCITASSDGKIRISTLLIDSVP